AEPGVAEERVGDEAGRRVAASGKRLGERRMGPVQPRVLAAQAQLVGPAAGEQAGVRGERPGGRRPRLIEPDRAGGQAVQVGRGRAVVAVEAQALGPHRVEHQQQDVGRALHGRGAGRRRPGPPVPPRALDPIPAQEADRHGAHRQGGDDEQALDPNRVCRAVPGRDRADARRQRHGGERIEPRHRQQQGQPAEKAHRPEREPSRPGRPQPGDQPQSQARSGEDRQVRRRDHPEEVPAHLERPERHAARDRVPHQPLRQLQRPRQQPEQQRQPRRPQRRDRPPGRIILRFDVVHDSPSSRPGNGPPIPRIADPGNRDPRRRPGPSLANPAGDAGVGSSFRS
ncbi:hypothetical protein HK102_012414, partial [Quaeritorhiza haematococci]